MSVLRIPQPARRTIAPELLPAPSPGDEGTGAPATALQNLSNELQTTLDLERLLAIFHAHAITFLGCDGLNYRNEREQIAVAFGKDAPHHCTYNLKVAQDELGELNLTRRRKFREIELGHVEELLCVLLYPLRNTLLYRAAVQSALRDPLTGACNRAAMNTAVHHEIAVSRRHGTPLSLIVLDIDHFKRINDNHGHAVGDCMLKALSSRVQQCIRDSDMLFRYGGEEFTVLLKNTDLDGALLLAERIRSAIAACHCECDGATLSLTISAGVACLRETDDQVSLFGRADKALYQAKQAGRNRVAPA